MSTGHQDSLARKRISGRTSDWSLTGHTWTSDELFCLNEPPWRHELIDGELFRMAPTGIEHGRLENRFSFLLSSHVFANDLGEVLSGDAGFLIRRSPDTVIAPDVAFIAKSRMELFKNEHRFSSSPPDLVGEIISPSDREPEIFEKTRLWLEFGMQAVAIVYPKDKRLVLYRSIIDRMEFGLGDIADFDFVVPGFQMNTADLFR